MSPVGGTARYVWYIECPCPPYETVDAAGPTAQARRHTPRQGDTEVQGVNQAADYTDNMWCRRGSQITAGDADVRGVRVDGT